MSVLERPFVWWRVMSWSGNSSHSLDQYQLVTATSLILYACSRCSWTCVYITVLVKFAVSVLKPQVVY